MSSRVDTRRIVQAWVIPPDAERTAYRIGYVTINGERGVDDLRDRTDAERIVRRVLCQRRDAAQIIRAQREGRKAAAPKRR
jgi:hypothetical protein